MKLYQLVATGFLVNTEHRVARHSTRIFDSPDIDQGFRDRFKKRVTSPVSHDDISYIAESSVWLLVKPLEYTPTRPKGIFDQLSDLFGKL